MLTKLPPRSSFVGLVLLSATLLIAWNSAPVFAQEGLTITRAVVAAGESPLFRLPFTEGIPLESRFILQQKSEPAEGEGEKEEEAEYKHELALILAGTYESSEEENYFTTGVEYKYSFHPQVGIMPTVEYVSGVDAWILVVPVFYRPAGGFKVFGGPGVELEPRRGSSEDGGDESSDHENDSEGEEESGTDALFLFRIGMAYSFEFGERFSITPGLELDFVNEEDGVTTALVYGVSFGIGF